MRHIIIWSAALFAAGTVLAAEHKFDLSQMTIGEAPKGFTSTVIGEGKPGNWQVVLDEVPEAITPILGNATGGRKSVLAQVSMADMTDEHFPLLILGNESYADFKFSTRFKIVAGIFEQMAGIAFRIQDEKNFYVLRASAVGNTLKFYKVQNGQRGTIIGPSVKIPGGEWHELSVECKGSEIRCFLDGKEMPPGVIKDDSFVAGKVGLWTKSDSSAHFADTVITYKPRESFAQLMVHDTMKEYPRLVGVKIFMTPPPETTPHMVASNDEHEVGQSGEKSDADVMDRGVNYYHKEKEVVCVTMPLRDRNGDIVAAVRVMMKSFPGQTEENAVVRAMPIVKEMQLRASSVNSLLE